MANVRIQVQTQIIDLDPSISIFLVLMQNDSSCWREGLGSQELAVAFLRGVQAGASMFAGQTIAVPTPRGETIVTKDYEI